MFQRIQHIGYYTTDLDGAVAWFEKSFGAVNAGGGEMQQSYAVPSGGRNAYVRFGHVETEIIEPTEKKGLVTGRLTMHHVGYVVENIEKSTADLIAKGFKFAGDSARTNVMGQQLRYFDSSTVNGALVHITQLPVSSGAEAVGSGIDIDRIVHAGYRVKDLDKAIAWYVDNYDGELIGGGPSRTGGRNAFVNFGNVQVELIQPPDTSELSDDVHDMDHVGYVVGDIPTCMGGCQERGLQFVADTPNTNSVQQQVLYFDTETTQGSRMHLTVVPS